MAPGVSQREIALALGIARPAVSEQHMFAPAVRHESVIESPAGTSSSGFVEFTRLIENVLGREGDLIGRGGLQHGLDGDIRHEAALL